MALTVQDVSDLAKLLVEHPEWRSELRRLLLSEELLALPDLMRQLGEKVTALAEAQQRTEQRVAELGETQGRVEKEIEELVQAQLRTEARLERMEQRLAKVDGRILEQEYREKASAYFTHMLRKTRVFSRENLADMLEGRLSPGEMRDALLTDVVICGQLRDRPEVDEVWLALEVSVVVDEGDVTRAGRRADLLQRTGYRSIPAVAGESITEAAVLEARRQSVVVLQEGRESSWAEALGKWIG